MEEKAAINEGEASSIDKVPHGYAMESTVRVGDYKLIRKYDPLLNPEALELYRLYDSSNGSQERVDIEEAKSLAKAMPEKTQEMNRLLTGMLTEMDASLPGKNPNCAKALPNKDHVPVVLEARQKGTSVGVRYEEHGAKVVRADLIYTLNGGQKYEEWFRAPAKLIGNGKILVQLPEGTTHYFINLTDENGFLVSYPELKDGKTPFNQVALTTSL